MAPPPGTLRVGRYFLALLLLLGVLYALVFFPGNRHTPKLGIDLVGGVRVIFKAIAPTGAPPPTTDQMSQARQILEDRINGTGVTGATVVIQGSDQLVVEIPSGTGTDVAKLGKAAVLNFRGVVAPAVPVACDRAVAATPTPSSTATNPAPNASSGAKKSSPPVSRPSASTPAGAATSPRNSAAPNGAGERPLAAPATSASRTPTPAGSSGTAKPTGSSSAAGATSAKQPCFSDFTAVTAALDPTLKIPTTETAYGKLSTKQKQTLSTGVPYSSLSATQKKKVGKFAYVTVGRKQQRASIPSKATVGGLTNFQCSSAQTELDKASSHYVACDTGKTYPSQSGGSSTVAYLLGKVIVPGRNIDDANAVAPNTSGQGGSADWTVELKLNGPGTDAWSSWTGAHNTNKASTGSVLQCGSGGGGSFPCSDWVGFTLDGQVLSAPQTQSPIGSTTQITGNFTQGSANELAKQLNYGKLPLSFRVDSNEQVSATLGSSQLSAAFLAGGIGLILVVIYSLLYYRGLGLVTIASLLVSGGLTYAMLVVLGEHLGFTLDLSGIAGFIVALGITADSFVVFFERIKDEVHEGRSVRVAIPRAWVRARRTVLSADTVSFLAAAILYYFASANVKGFAFTLGLSTILDLVVVFLFTHPIVSLLSRSRTFGSPRFTGLNALRVGGFDVDDDAPRGKRGAGARAAERRGERPDRSKPRRAARTATVVLDKPDAPDEPDDTEDLDAIESDDLEAADVEPDEAEPDEAEPEEAEPEEAEPDEAMDGTDDAEPRRRTTPEPGTAAERAAARRARMRGKNDPRADGEGTS